MSDKETVTLPDVKCIASTEKAALCTGGPLSSREVWFPLSQIDDDSEVYRKGDHGNLIVTKWIALQKELCDEDGDLL